MYEYADSVSLDVVNDPNRYGGMMAYCRSKMAQVMYTWYLARLLEEKRIPVTVTVMYTWYLARLLEEKRIPVTVTVCHPGSVDTNILKESGFQWVQFVFRPLMWFLLKTKDDGAQVPLFLALSDKIHKCNGQYFRDFAVHKPVGKCWNEESCKKLFEESFQAVEAPSL
ncbi:hypothetical protein TELCIR_06668 [Teladorsagia circumcincta]|uniref:Uncharacterized protein n=1 Tax=Teladorsagia circumcincta TaxID=45464 RepID=A0A2G9UMG3_TELCI|nr:hypothetical protein TELCIR_06668 [Teladorsagia circumcincta]